MWDWIDDVIGLFGDSGDVAGDLFGGGWDVFGGAADDLIGGGGDVFGGASDAVFDTWTNTWVDPGTLLAPGGPTGTSLSTLLGLAPGGPTGTSLSTLLEQTDPGSQLTGLAPGGPTGTSLSDQIRSEAMDSATPGTEPFNPLNMADPSASIESTGYSDWQKAAAQSLKGLLGGLGTSLTDSARRAGGVPALSLPSGNPMSATAVPGLSAGSAGPSLGLMGSSAGSPSESGLPGALGLPSDRAIGAALARLQAEAPGRVGIQGPIDAGRIPAAFTPINMAAPASAPIAPAAPQYLSGLQRLALERRG
jgi:hypothetical protein